MKNIFPNNLEKTKKSLKKYDRVLRKTTRELKFDSIETTQDANEYFLYVKNQENLIREAFFQDTSEINSHDNCMLVDISTLRKWCSKIKSWQRLVNFLG